ncbi:MAG: hypothetical protein J4215_04640 [Candidatus Diapherotrites archaeon]|uniref:Methyltransferase domain-containing protein n=1 Tax=Candidatus Iainarchaeum sp. TaxID=3101447 RepID=A0A8T4LAW2_9ARCH|nr:hypothetical protein [Candidatus Diapherotrites archaeon]
MPHPKKRQQQIHSRQQRRQKRGQWLKLSAKEREEVRFQREYYPKISDYLQPDQRSIFGVSDLHEHDFLEAVVSQRQKKPNEPIHVLNEGAGRSTFSAELKQLANLFQIPVQVTETDLRPLFRATKNVSPEEIVSKFGKKKFQVIVSTFGGFNYTRANRRHALVNFIQALSPGGLASIVFMHQHLAAVSAEVRQVQKRFPEISFEIKQNRRIHAAYILTMRKPASSPNI